MCNIFAWAGIASFLMTRYSIISNVFSFSGKCPISIGRTVPIAPDRSAEEEPQRCNHPTHSQYDQSTIKMFHDKRVPPPAEVPPIPPAPDERFLPGTLHVNHEGGVRGAHATVPHVVPRESRYDRARQPRVKHERPHKCVLYVEYGLYPRVEHLD